MSTTTTTAAYIAGDVGGLYISAGDVGDTTGPAYPSMAAALRDAWYYGYNFYRLDGMDRPRLIPPRYRGERYDD